MADEAFASLKTAGDKWINQRVDDAEDIVKKFTKGKTTLVSQMFNQQKLPFLPNWFSTIITIFIKSSTSNEFSPLQTKLKREAVQTLETIQDLLMNPFNDILGLADNFISRYSDLFGLVHNIKKAYDTLKEG